MNFSEIIKPITECNFFSEYWTTKTLLIKGHSEKFEALITLNDFLQNLKMSCYNTTIPNIEMYKHGTKVPLQEFTKVINPRKQGIEQRYIYKKISDLYNAGATINYKNVQFLIAPLFKLRDSISVEFNEEVNFNSYLTPPNSSGFRIHYDTHDIFVLQISGEKNWSLFGQTIEAPIKHENYLSRNQTPPKNIVENIRMSAGDVLYLPRGHWHKASTTDKHSLHVTLGIHCRKHYEIFDELVKSKLFFRENLIQYDQQGQKIPIKPETLKKKHLEALSEILTENLNSFLTLSKKTNNNNIQIED